MRPLSVRPLDAKSAHASHRVGLTVHAAVVLIAAEWAALVLAPVVLLFWLLVIGLLWRQAAGGGSTPGAYRWIVGSRRVLRAYGEAIVQVGLANRLSPTRGFVIARVIVDVLTFVATWTCVAFGLRWLAPHLVVTSSDAISSLAQAIPAAVVALYSLLSAHCSW